MLTVTVSTPGCLPEAEPFTCEDITTARAVVAHEIESDWDAAYERASARSGEPGFDVREERLRVDGLFLEAHTMVNSLNVNESITVNDLVYEIHA